MTNKNDDVASLTLHVLQKIQAELVGIRTEMKEESAALRAEMKAESTALRAELKDQSVALRQEMHDGFTRLRTEIVDLRGDVEIGFTATRLQNDRRFLDHERRLRDLEGR